MTAPTPDATRLLRDAERYLSALHGSVARHDNLAANFGCAGCELRDQIGAALPMLAAAPSPAPADRPIPDFTSPLAGRIEVRDPCPWCPDRPMVPRSEMDEHVARLHPDVQTVEVASAGLVAVPPTVWIDGHPQLEAIAAAVWESCRTEESSTVVDDPRNIAVAALAAVLGMLPAGSEDTTTTRAATLRAEAARIRAHCPDHLDSDSADGSWTSCHCDVADDMLRRLADETQPSEAPAHSCGNCEGIDPGSCLANPDRPKPPPMDPWRILGIDNCLTPATHNQGCACTAAAEPEPVRHAPGRAILCPDCSAKGRAVCMADEPEPPVCEGFQWIGQSFATCDRCGQPAWEHVGEEIPVEGAGLFDNRRTVRPWKPGEADRIRAKWDRPAAAPAGVQTDEETSR